MDLDLTVDSYDIKEWKKKLVLIKIEKCYALKRTLLRKLKKYRHERK